MKLALVHQPWSWAPPAPSDPMGMSVHETARRLAQSCPVVCYGTRHRGQASTENVDGVEIRRIRAPLDRLLKPLLLADKLKLRSPSRPFNASRLYRLGYVTKVAADLPARGCDLVHLHQFPQWAAMVRRRNPGLRIVLQIHDTWLTRIDPAIVRVNLAAVDLVLAGSDFMATAFTAAFPEWVGRCHRAFAGIDDAFFDLGRQRRLASGSPLRILFPGPLSAAKGVAVLLDAFEQVLKIAPQATLTIVGGAADASPDSVGTLRGSLSPAAAAAVTFAGDLAGPDLLEQYRQADVCVAPSLEPEMLGVPLIRGMAAALVPVATSSGAYPDYISTGQTGLLVAPHDAGGLAKALISLIADPLRFERIRLAAQSRAESLFGWQPAIAELQRLYTLALAQQAGP